MSDSDKVTMTEGELDTSYTQKWLDGKALGVRDVCGWLDKRAGGALRQLA